MLKRHRHIVRHISCIPSITPDVVVRILTNTSLTEPAKNAPFPIRFRSSFLSRSAARTSEACLSPA